MRKPKIVATLDAYIEEHISSNNDIIKSIYLNKLKKDDNTEDEVIMARGRKAREITTEMVADLSKLNKEEYMAKHKVGEMMFLNLYYKNVSMQEEKIVEKEVRVDMFEGILMDTDILYNKGFVTWLKHISEQQQKTDYAISDIRHHIQLKDDHTQAEKIALFDMLQEQARINALYDDSYQFASANKHKIIDLIELQKLVQQKRDYIKKRKYNVRVLVGEFGATIDGGR